MFVTAEALTIGVLSGALGLLLSIFYRFVVGRLLEDNMYLVPRISASARDRPLAVIVLGPGRSGELDPTRPASIEAFDHRLASARG